MTSFWAKQMHLEQTEEFGPGLVREERHLFP